MVHDPAKLGWAWVTPSARKANPCLAAWILQLRRAKSCLASCRTRVCHGTSLCLRGRGGQGGVTVGLVCFEGSGDGLGARG